MELQGKLYEKNDAVKRSDKFTVREFVVEVANPRDSRYNDFVLFRLTNDRCNLIDRFNVGDQLQVTFDVNGRRWQSPEGRIAYFNSLTAWRLDPVEVPNLTPNQSAPAQPSASAMQPLPPMAEPAKEDNAKDDLPF